MLGKLLKKMFGSRNKRILRDYYKLVAKINALEPSIQDLSDQALSAKTHEFRQRIAQGNTLDALLVEAFAVVREASRRTLGLRHFDVQLIGAMVLHHGKIAEMRTGEGKTLVATLPAYLNALSGQGVHVVTVNDYLAQRDAQWMAPIYEFLGLTVGMNLTEMDFADKKAAYAADITYGTNNEFGFDYLRDHMALDKEQLVQRALSFAIIDEVDSILIDESRTPLIISGKMDETSKLYEQMNQIVPKLKRQMIEEDPTQQTPIPPEKVGDYYADEKTKQVHLTEQGHQRIESIMLNANMMPQGTSLYDASNIKLMHYLNAALRAHALFHQDIDYIVKDAQVVIVDEHTGRMMSGRRWSDGLHQALEAKEGVVVQMENQTLATITFQNYFRLYEKLSGMTGTADTEAFELQQIYGLEVIVIPTNVPMIREDKADQIFLTIEDKYQAIVDDIKNCQKKGQPILVGTASVEASETVSRLLKKDKIAHEVLNAKNHGREAKIIAQAGRPGAVTIATNMAGRGTDIVLGGNVEAEISELKSPSKEQIALLREQQKKRQAQVIRAGGLHICGTERNESRRIDNQLRGRAGRQGDPGSSQFYLSMDDHLLRIFAAERMKALMGKLGLKQGEMIQHPWLNHSIENAQRRVEGMNFDMRKQLLEYDDVVNDQRKVIYRQQRQLMESPDISEVIANMHHTVVENLCAQYLPEDSIEEQWNISGLQTQLAEDFHLTLDIKSWLKADESIDDNGLLKRIKQAITQAYQQKKAEIDNLELWHDVEKSLTLQIIGHHWRDHLAAMDHLRQGIHLRGYAQQNPAQEYKRESFAMFSELLARIKYEVVSTLARITLATKEAVLDSPKMVLNYHHDSTSFNQSNKPPEAIQSSNEQSAIPKPFIRGIPKVGRNETCPCGSGKKYKYCHGKIH